MGKKGEGIYTGYMWEERPCDSPLPCSGQSAFSESTPVFSGRSLSLLWALWGQLKLRACLAPACTYSQSLVAPKVHNLMLSSVQLLSHVWLFATPWTVARQASVSITNTWSPPKPMSIGDAIQPSHPLSSPSPSTFNLFQHQGLFQWVNSSHQVAKGLELQLQHQPFQWTPRTDFL